MAPHTRARLDVYVLPIYATCLTSVAAGGGFARSVLGNQPRAHTALSFFFGFLALGLARRAGLAIAPPEALAVAPLGFAVAALAAVLEEG